MSWMLALLFVAPAFAQEDAEDAPIDEITGLPDVRALDLGDEDDLDIAMPPPPEPEKVGPPALALDPGAAQPLTAAFPATIAAVGAGTVVVELPVYVAKAARSPEPGLMLIGEFLVGTTKVGEARQILEPGAILATGPTYAFLKAVVPTATPTGTVTIVVKTAAKDGRGAKEAFRTTVSW